MKDIFLINNPNDYLVLVNKFNTLSNAYIPNDLELINSIYSNNKKYLRKKIKNCFCKYGL